MQTNNKVFHPAQQKQTKTKKEEDKEKVASEQACHALKITIYM